MDAPRGLRTGRDHRHDLQPADAPLLPRPRRGRELPDASAQTARRFRYMIRGVLFDLDGTLLDTEPDFTAILNAMLTQHGRKTVDGALVRKFVSSGALSVVRQGFDLPENDPLGAELLKDFLD